MGMQRTGRVVVWDKSETDGKRETDMKRLENCLTRLR